MRSRGKLPDLVNYPIDDCMRAKVVIIEEEIEEPRFAEFYPVRLGSVSFNQPIRIKEEHIALFQVQGLALILLFVEDPEQ